MSTTQKKEEDQDPVINQRSKDEILEEEIRNQQTIDIFTESDKNWC